MGPRPLGPKEIDGLLVSPGKDYTLLTGHMITGLILPRKSGFKSSLCGLFAGRSYLKHVLDVMTCLFLVKVPYCGATSRHNNI